METDITVQKFDMVCRTCMTLFEPPYECYSIMDNVCRNRIVAEMLEFHTNVKVLENDKLPQNICSDCFDELRTFLKFAKRCRMTNQHLHNLWNKEHKVEHEEGTYEVETKMETHDANDTNEKKAPDEYIEIKLEEEPNILDNLPSGSQYIIQEYEDVQNPLDELVDSEEYVIEGFEAADVEEGIVYVCSVCNEGFTSTKELELHLRTHIIKPSDEQIKESDALILQMLNGDIEKADDAEDENEDLKGEHRCEICGRVFTTNFELMCHLSRHKMNRRGRKKREQKDSIDDVKSRTCNLCHKVFATKISLQSHKIRHQERSWKCDRCGYMFHTKAGLEIHFRSHSGEKPYKCSYCNKAFSQQGSLSLHLLVHTGERPHQCHLCPAAFKQAHHLQYHLQSHSGEKPFVCTLCDKGFASKRNLVIHSRSHTGHREYICPICGKGFYDRHGVNKHIKRHVFGNTKVKFEQNGQEIAGEYPSLDQLLFKGSR